MYIFQLHDFAVCCTSYILTDKDYHRWSFLLVYIVLLTAVDCFPSRGSDSREFRYKQLDKSCKGVSLDSETMNIRCWRVSLRGMMRWSLMINKFWRLLRGKYILDFVKFPWEFIRLWIINRKSTLSFVFFSSLFTHLMGIGWPAVKLFQTTVCKLHPKSIKL